MVDISRAMINPAAVFQDPEEVVDHPRLTREQQIEILRRWAYDACAMEVAEEENMTSPYESGLEQMVQALQTRGVGLGPNVPLPLSMGVCRIPTRYPHVVG
jgi:hypothetical protein